MLSSTPLQIKNHPSNTSKSKHHWSFSKTPRFKSARSNCSQSFYELGSSLSVRKASFGYGGRTKFFDGKSEVPQSGKYEVTTDIQKNRKKSKGFSFTANRQNLKFSNYTKTMEATPDPSNYDINEQQIRGKKAYSLRPKTAYPKNYFIPNQSEAAELQEKPGPGKYATIDTLGTKYMTKNNNHAKSFERKDRFYKEKATPGPLDYTNKTIEPDGIYYLSNMKSNGRRTFLEGRRNLRLQGNKQTPGPGSYRLQSDFGHYQNQCTSTTPVSPSK